MEAMVSSTPTPTTLTTKNQPFPASTSSYSGSASITSLVPTITSYPTLSSSSSFSSGNGTSNTTTAQFGWDCSHSSNARASLFENFSGCTYAQSSVPTARPSNGTNNGTVTGSMPFPTAGAGVKIAASELGSFSALGLVLVAMLGWL